MTKFHNKKNQPWKSKVEMIKLCAAIGATLEPDRRTDPNGKRVYVVIHEDKIMGFETIKDIYIWLVRQLKHIKT
ncbi:MAG: hypothetical protein WC479_06395 [Candidatus Izemoplasmatales bacterium]